MPLCVASPSTTAMPEVRGALPPEIERAAQQHVDFGDIHGCRNLYKLIDSRRILDGPHHAPMQRAFAAIGRQGVPANICLIPGCDD
jgi:hypothetical protein